MSPLVHACLTHLLWFPNYVLFNWSVCTSFYRYGDRIVAIKVLNCGNTSEERSVLESRFVREVTMMSRVKHENLVKVRLPDEVCCFHLTTVLCFPYGCE